MNFVMLILNQNIKTMQNFVTWILTALLFILKRKIFMKMLQMMLKKKNDTSNYDSDRPFPTKKNNQINERQTRRKDYDEICSS